MYQYPFKPEKITVASHCISCVDEGAGDSVVMVHGNPSWSYLYRNLIGELSGEYHCLAPDHLGCGLSDKPQDYSYTLSQHIDNLEVVLAARGVKKCVLVVHDWGGAIGMGWAGRHPEKIAGLVVLNSAAFPAPVMPLRIALCRTPVLGEIIVRGLNGFAWPSSFMAVNKPMDKKVARAFLFPYNSWRNRIAIHRFVKDIPMNEKHPSWQTILQVEKGLDKLQGKPMLVLWGGKDFCFNRYFYEQWLARFPEADGHYFADGGHYVLEDVFAEAVALIKPFLKSCYG